MPILSSSDNFERWTRNGSLDANDRATKVYTKMLEDYDEPPLDPAIREELDDYVIRRRRELGD